MNTPRITRSFASIALGLGAVIALAGEPAAAAAPSSSQVAARTAPAEKIPAIVIAAKRLTPEQKAAMDQLDEKHGSKGLAEKNSAPKRNKPGGSVG